MIQARAAFLLLLGYLAGAGKVLASRIPDQGIAPEQQAASLKSLSLEQLGKIEVTTQSKEPTQVWDTPAAIFVLTQEDIRRSGVTNVPDALRLVPGVNVARVNGSRNWAVGIRGFGDQFSKYVLVLIDGRSVYTPLFGGVLWTINNVMLEDVDRIEVIRGPGGTIWGADAVNGIINIITKSAAETRGLLLSSGGGNVDEDTGDMRFGASGSGFDYRVYATGFVRAAEYHTGGQRNYDGSRLAQVGMRCDRKVGRDEITIQGDAYFGKLGDAQNLATFTPPATAVSYAAGTAAGGNILGRWRRSLGGHSDLYLQSFWSRDYRNGSNFGETRDTFDVDFLHRLPSWKITQLTYGAGLRLSPSTVKQVVPTATFSPLGKTDSVYSGFLQEELRLVPSVLSLTLGSKLESNNYTGFEYQPNGRLLWTPRETQTVWASISRAVRTPDRVDEDIRVDVLALNPPPIYGELVGNNSLRPERLIGYEVGYRALLGSKLYFGLAGFHNQYRDLIAQGPATIVPPTIPPFPPSTLLFRFQLENGVHGATDGFEFAPDWRPTEWWQLKAAYSYLHLDLQDQKGFTDSLTLKSLRGSSPNSQAVLRSLMTLPRNFEFDNTIRYVGALHAQHVRAYVTGDSRIGYRIGKSLDLSVVGENLFQPHHAEFGIDPPPAVLIKRSVYAKFVWTP